MTDHHVLGPRRSFEPPQQEGGQGAPEETRDGAVLPDEPETRVGDPETQAPDRDALQEVVLFPLLKSVDK